MVNPTELKIIFVVGSVRSGTSIVGQGLDHVLGNGRGFSEGNVTGMITALSDAIDSYYNNFAVDFLRPESGSQISRLPKDWVKAVLQRFVVSEVARPIISSGLEAWVDKSPDGTYRAERVRSCEILAKAFPNAKFVFCRRQGLENISSRMRKWGNTAFATHCHGWAGIMSAWENVRPKLAGRYTEVDQHMIATNPGKVADDLALTLSMTPAERDAIHAYLRDQTVEQTIADKRQAPRSLQEIDWELMQKWIFLAVCGGSMSRYGYELGEVPAPHPAAPVLTLGHPTIQTEMTDVDEYSGQATELPGGFQLNPAEAGQPAPVIRFRSVPASSEMRLRGALVHGACEGAGVGFDIRITETSGREVLAGRYVVAPGDALELNELFFSRTNEVDVEVSTSISIHNVAQSLPPEDGTFSPSSNKPRKGGPWLRPSAFARPRVVGLSCTPATPMAPQEEPVPTGLSQ